MLSTPLSFYNLAEYSERGHNGRHIGFVVTIYINSTFQWFLELKKKHKQLQTLFPKRICRKKLKRFQYYLIAVIVWL